MIDRRRETIEQQLEQAEQTRKAAEETQKQYENRQAQWEKEKQKARAELQMQLDAERQRQMQEISASIAQEKEKNQVAFDKQLQQLQQEKEHQALLQGAQFVSTLLKNFESQVIENKLIDMLLSSLEKLPEQQKRTLQDLYNEEQAAVKVITAMKTDELSESQLRQALSALVNADIQCDFQVDPQLIAGIRINIGPFVLRANLEDELQYFCESSNGYSG